MNPNKSRNYVAAKRRKRMELPPPDYGPDIDHTKPARRLIYEDCLTGDKHEFLLFISPQRVDQYRVEVDGQIWMERAGFSRILAGLRKAVPRFSKIQD
ncbi:MAG: hypothetical protein KGL39_45030 [Patescibacteria group bacterium]|nr:hypothetical protein [Patescibacteria group bacterium]